MYRFVETPSRKTGNIGFIKPIVLPFITLLVCFIGFNAQKLVYSEEEMRVFAASEDRVAYGCDKLARISNPLARVCEVTHDVVNPEQRILLVGNSHADAIKTTFASQAEALHVKLYFIIPQVNPLMEGGMSAEAIVNEALSKKVTTIVLHHSLPVTSPSAIKRLVDLAERKGIWVSLIMPVPIWDVDIPEAMYKHMKYKTPLPSQSLDAYKKSIQGIDEGVSAISNSNFSVYHLDNLLCPEACLFVNDKGQPLYFDSDHLTLTGSKRLDPLFKRVISDSLARKVASALDTQQ